MTGRTQHRRRRRLAIGLAAVAALAAVDLGLQLAVGAAERSRDQARDEQAAAELRLATVEAELAAADDRAAHDRVLARRTDERAAATSEDLTAQQAFLAECLEGVSALVNQLAVGDRNGAVRTADAIAPSCAAVGAAIA